MLKRSDLAKQFEILVQQEVKNHNNSLLATNISINELRSLCEDNCKSIAKEKAERESKMLSFFTSFLDFREEIVSFSNNLQSQINDSKAKNDSLSAALINLSLEFEKINIVQRVQEDKLNKLCNEFDGLSKRIKELHTQYKIDLSDHNVKNEQNLNKAKEEILNMPSEAQKVKYEIEGKMAIDRVDFKCLMRELQVHKKTVFIIEKQIENIYTLIERLKG